MNALMSRLHRIRVSVERSFAEYAPTRGVAFILGLNLLFYGLWLFLPIDSFANPAYALMANIANREVWASVFAFCGSSLMYGVWKKNDEWIQRGAWLGFVIWTVVAVLGSISVPAAPIIIVRGTLAVMHAWVYIQVRLHPYLVNGYVKMTDLAQYVQDKNIQKLKENDTNDYE